MNKLGAYVGMNWDSHYRGQFQRLLDAERTGGDAGWMWNWPAALTPLWFLYRRLYGAFFLYAALHILLGKLGMTIPLAIVQGCRGDKLLYRKARKVVRLAGENADSAWLARRGKPQEWVAWTPVASLAAAVILLGVMTWNVDSSDNPAFTAEQNATAPFTPPLMFQNPKVVLSRDGGTQITVPGAWSSLPMPNELLQIRVESTGADQAIATFTDAKSDIPEPVGLEYYAQLSAQAVRNHLPPGSMMSGPIPLTVQGNPAIQYEITDRSGESAIVWVTVVETPSDYHRVIATGDLDRADEIRPLLQEVIHTFRETT